MNLSFKRVLAVIPAVMMTMSLMAAVDENMSIIPYPVSLEKTNGIFKLESSTIIIAPKEAGIPAAALADALETSLGKPIKISRMSLRSKNIISLKIG